MIKEHLATTISWSKPCKTVAECYKKKTQNWDIV